jgi:tagatose 6-phosphate kinase
MITTVTLNPAIDKVCTTQGLRLGNINRMESVTNIAGGKGVNVAKILRQYGYEVAVLGFIAGYSGAFVADCLQSIGVATAFTKVGGETRVSTNIIGADGYTTEILEPGPEVAEAELAAFMAVFAEWLPKSELVVLSGSVPGGIGANIYAELTKLVKESGKKAVLDTSDELLTNAVKAKPYMIKPNLAELEYLLGRRLRGLEAATEAIRGLVDSGIGHVLLSLGEKGVLYASEGAGEVLYAKPPKLKAINTIGCGDSVVASFCISQLEGHDREETLRRAVAISATAASLPGIAESDREKAEELYKDIEVKAIT